MPHISPEVERYQAAKAEFLDGYDFFNDLTRTDLYRQVADLQALRPTDYQARDDALISRVFRPDTTYNPQAIETARFCLENRIPILSLADHTLLPDHFNDKAAYMGVPGLEAIKDEGVILAKFEYFFKPGGLGRTDRYIAEKYIDQRAVPVIRPHDTEPFLASLSPSEKEQYKDLSAKDLMGEEAILNFCLNILAGRPNVGFLHLYPESTRNGNKPADVLKIKGLAVTLIHKMLEEDHLFAVMFTGGSYGHYEKTPMLYLPWNSPRRHIGQVVLSSAMDDIRAERERDQITNIRRLCANGLAKAKQIAYETPGMSGPVLLS